MTINSAVEILEFEFERMVEIFKTPEWKLYKFGAGGPYKRELTKLQKLSNKYDIILQNSFGIDSDIASFNSLINLCIFVSKVSKNEYNSIQKFKKQLTRMKKIF